MKIDYKILPELNLLIQKYSHDFSIDTYTDYMYKIMEMPEWQNITKVLTDVRDIDPTEALRNVKFLRRFREEIIKRNYLNVFIVNTPSATATAHIYQEDLVKKDYGYKYFSSLETALEELEVKDHYKEIEEILEGYK